MIHFNRIADTTTNEQKAAIWDWCEDHTREFGAIPMECVITDDESEEEVVFNYDQMLSALSDEQIRTLDGLIDAHEA